MIPDIKIEVPTPTTLVIRQAQLIAYQELRIMRDEFPRGADTRPHRYGRLSSSGAGSTGDYKLLLNFGKTNQIYELIFPTEKWNDLLYRKSQFLANPDNKVALFFIGSKNFNKITGHPAGTEIFMIGDDLYRKITWRSLGVKNNNSAVKLEDNGQLISFLHKCKKVNKEPLRSLITDSVGSEIMRREEEKAKAKAS